MGTADPQLGFFKETTYQIPTDLSTKVVVLGVEESNERRVDGALVRQLDGTLGQDLENLDLVGGEIGLKNARQTLQVALERRSALLKLKI